MNWPKIVILAFIALSLLGLVAKVGQPRPPLTGGVAALSLVLWGGIAWLVVIA